MADSEGVERLAPRRFEPLSLGTVTPRGWLKRQLRVQADGITGVIDERWPDLADNQWLGGRYDGWERGPYYVDGLVPLAHLLEDDDLLAKAETWVEGFRSYQDEDGWIGPDESARDQGYERDPWPCFVVLKALRQHAEATGDEDAVETMLAFCRYLESALEEQPLESWGMYRWADLVTTLHWLYERTDEQWLLDVAETAADQGFDWEAHFEEFPHTTAQPLDERRMDTHVVNIAMGVKSPAVRARQRGSDDGADAIHDALGNLDRYHGQASGLYTGDEHLGGKHPGRGTELCAVVELMYSLERAVSLTGDPAFGDRLERVTYNGLPATFSPDMRVHQYDQQANQVLCSVAEREWTNGPDANVFGMAPNFGCCAANLHQGWPKFAASLWMGTPDGGLATVAYAPCEVTTDVDGTAVTVTEETTYPFEETVTIAVDPDEPVAFPLSLRIPGWTDDATLTLPDGETTSVESGTYRVVEREWTAGAEVTLELTSSLEAEQRHHGAVSLRRGPLTFALSPDERWQQVDDADESPHADREIFPQSSWNYGLEVDADDPGESAEVRTSDPGELPFDPESPPVELTVRGKQVPDWGIADHRADAVPSAPVDPDTPSETLTLAPYGCTNLRVTEFPLVEPETDNSD